MRWSESFPGGQQPLWRRALLWPAVWRLPSTSLYRPREGLAPRLEALFSGGVEIIRMCLRAAGAFGVMEDERSHSRHEVCSVERLVDDRINAPGHLGRVRVGAHDQDGHARGALIGAHALDQLLAGHHRHHQVGHHQVGKRTLHLSHRLAAVLRLAHLKAIGFQDQPEQVPDDGSVVNDQHPLLQMQVAGSKHKRAGAPHLGSSRPNGPAAWRDRPASPERPVCLYRKRASWPAYSAGSKTRSPTGELEEQCAALKEKVERYEHEERSHRIGSWSAEGREYPETDQPVQPVFVQPGRADDADASQGVQDDRELEDDPKSDDQHEHEAEVVVDKR